MNEPPTAVGGIEDFQKDRRHKKGQQVSSLVSLKNLRTAIQSVFLAVGFGEL